ncbi:MAG TPA: rhomboid family intramembrane serine protease [Firmicutes bacterium]|nr:rhomboid family intramembrane serine protease [Bacillota bacterium]
MGWFPYRSWRHWSTASATNLLIAINLAVFITDFILGGVLTQFGLKFGPAIWQGQYYRLVTALFLHAGIFHLLFNLYALYYLGPALEIGLGRHRFWLLYLLSGVTGNLLSLRLAPLAPSLGASGAIFGLLGYYLYLSLALPRPSLRQGVVTIIVVNLLWGFLPGSRIDNFAHLGGLLGGFLLGPLFRSSDLAPAPLRPLGKALPAVAGAGLALLWIWCLRPPSG